MVIPNIQTKKQTIDVPNIQIPKTETGFEWRDRGQPTLKDRVRSFFDPIVTFFTGLKPRERPQTIIEPTTKEKISIPSAVPTVEMRPPFQAETKQLPIAKEKLGVLKIVPEVVSRLLEIIPKWTVQSIQNFREIQAKGEAQPLKLPFDAKRLGFDTPEVESTGRRLWDKYNELNEIDPPKDELGIWKNAALSSLMVVVPDALDAFIAGNMIELSAKSVLKVTKYDPQLERSLSELGLPQNKPLTPLEVMTRTKESMMSSKSITEYANSIRNGRYVAQQMTEKGIITKINPFFKKIQDVAKNLILPLEQYGKGFQVSPIAERTALGGFADAKGGLSISPKIGGDDLTKQITNLAKQNITPEVIAKTLGTTEPIVNSIIEQIGVSTIPQQLQPLEKDIQLFRGDAGNLQFGAGTDIKKLASRPQGLSMTTDINIAKKFSGGKGISPEIFKDTNRIDTFTLKADAKVLDSKTLGGEFEKTDSQGVRFIDENDVKTIKFARQNGYDAIDFSNDTRKLGGKEKEIIIINSDAIKINQAKGITPEAQKGGKEAVEPKIEPKIEVVRKATISEIPKTPVTQKLINKLNTLKAREDNLDNLIEEGDYKTYVEGWCEECFPKDLDTTEYSVFAERETQKIIKENTPKGFEVVEAGYVEDEVGDNPWGASYIIYKKIPTAITKEVIPKVTKEVIKPGIFERISKTRKVATIGKALSKVADFISRRILKIVEPAKLIKNKALFPIVTKGTYGKTEAKLIEFDQTELDSVDKTIIELEEWYSKNFTEKDLKNLMLSRGTPASLEASKLQTDAIKALPQELKLPVQKQAIQEIADFNYDFLQRVAEGNLHKVADYFYGMYKDPKAVDKFLEYWQTTERFIKHKSIPTVADATARGLELKYNNPVTNLRAEFRAIAKLDGMQWMKNELLNTGEGIYIDTIEKAPVGWERINDPVFGGLRVEKDLAISINNLIETNKISGIPALNTLRKINNYLRTIKFVGSAFHALVEAKQSVADTGFAQFIHEPITVLRGTALRGFKKADPIFQTPEYKKYIELGGGHQYSMDFQAKQMLSDMVDKINNGQYLGAFTKVGITPVKIPTDFVKWMFNKYIPKIKYAKYLDIVSTKENKLDRMLTSEEALEIIKEGQNFYGMMNERLFGRSGTTTTLLRFVFMAPGFAEGNYRTIIKAFSQWGFKGTYGAGRSRYNIVNSLLLTGMLATVGTLIMTKKLPEKPKKLEDIRDLFKIDTGRVDKRGKKIMIDLLTYDKDYWNITFNVLRGRPDIAVTESVKRVGGMKASTLGILVDFAKILQGEAIYDWKDDKVFYVTDPFLLRAQKLFVHEIKRLEPIALSVYKQLREKEVDTGVAAIAAFLGVRATKTEQDKRDQEVLNRLFSFKDQQEQLYYYLGTIKNPRESIEKYNQRVNDILESSLVSQEMKNEWEPKLIIDTNGLLSNKIFQLTGPMTNMSDSEKITEITKVNKYLQNFGVSNLEAKELLNYYFEQHPVKNPTNASHLQTVRERNERLIDSFSSADIKNIEIPNIEIPNIEIPNINTSVLNIEAKKGEKLNIPEGKVDSKGIIHTIALYAKAIGTDPLTAFNRIFTGQKIRRIDSKTIIVERMPFEESQAVRNEQGVVGDMKLDHTIPLELGGSNAESNLKLVSNAEWTSYTPVENHLGKLLREGKITKKEAQTLIKDFKDGKINADQILKK